MEKTDSRKTPTAMLVIVGLTACFAVGLAGGAYMRSGSAPASAPPAPTVAKNDAQPPSNLPPSLAKKAPPPSLASASARKPTPVPDPSLASPAALAALQPTAAPPREAPQAPAATGAPTQLASAASTDMQSLLPPEAAPAAASATPSPSHAPDQVAVAHAERPDHAVTHSRPGQGAAGAFRVQYGAFSVEENAKRLRKSIDSAGRHAIVEQGPDAAGHTLYFVRSPVYGDYAQAQNAAAGAEHAAKRGKPGLPLKYVILHVHATEATASRSSSEAAALVAPR